MQVLPNAAAPTNIRWFGTAWKPAGVMQVLPNAAAPKKDVQLAAAPPPRTLAARGGLQAARCRARRPRRNRDDWNTKSSTVSQMNVRRSRDSRRGSSEFCLEF